MKVTIIGAGYVGLVTAACFASFGNDVICVEKNRERISKLNSGVSPIYEPGLDELLTENIKSKRITFTDDIKKGIDFSNIIFLCVGTPQDDNGKADLSQVEEASRQIALNLNEFKIIVEKSTVPVNTHLWVKKTINRYAKKDIKFSVASNPEFLREGSAIKDFTEPDRIVVGVEDSESEKVFRELYKPLTDKGFPLLVTAPPTAELIKHASNSFLAMKISFINIVANLCEKSGADIETVAHGMGLDKRIGRSFLNAGIGYGGSCFPKDVKAFINMGEEFGLNFNLLREVDKINSDRRAHFLKLVESVLWINKDKTISIWGLAFKPNTDDVRESPAIDIVKHLLESGAKIKVFDPVAMGSFKRLFPESEQLIYCSDMYEPLKESNALLIVTEWEEFKKADLKRVKELLTIPIIVDGRNIYDKDRLRELDIEYFSIGR